MLIKKRYVVGNTACPCPSCAEPVRSVSYEYRQSEKLSRIFLCERCTFLFARPVIIPDLANRQMDSVSDAELFNHSFLKSLHEKLIIGKEISSVKKVQGGRAGALLDIGCGTGWTTELWKNAGYSVSGLEPSPARAEMAERRGVRILGGYLEEYTGEELFDVIVLRHVVEHFGEPYEALSRVRGMLRSGGVLVLVVPNIDCIGRFLFQERWSWILPWHCNFFNPKSARTIVERAGLAIEKCYQTPSPLWYPESMARSFPNSRLVRKLFGSRGILPLVLCAPIVLAGFLTGRNDNLTLLARRL